MPVKKLDFRISLNSTLSGRVAYLFLCSVVVCAQKNVPPSYDGPFRTVHSSAAKGEKREERKYMKDNSSSIAVLGTADRLGPCRSG